MKKALIILLLIAMTGNVFAQRRRTTDLDIRAGIDTIFVPFQYVQKEVEVQVGGETVKEKRDLFGMGMGRFADNNRNIVGRFNFEGQVENLGFKLHLQAFATGNSDAPQLSSGAEASRIAWGFSDAVEMWWQPLNFLKFDVGKFRVNDIQGKIGDNWTNRFTVGSYDQYEIFSPFRTWTVTNAWGSGTNGIERNDFGVMTSFELNGIGAYVMISGLWPTDMRIGNWYRPDNNGVQNGYPEHNPMEIVDPIGNQSNNGRAAGNGDLLRTLERTQIALAYTFSGLGLARVQYVGAQSSLGYSEFKAGSLIDNENQFYNTPRVEAAFLFSKITGLALDLGLKYHLPWKADKVKAWNVAEYKWGFPEWDYSTGKFPGILQKSHQVSLGAEYVVEPISPNLVFTGRLDTRFGGTYDYNDGTDIVKLPVEINFHMWPTYNFGIFALGLDFGLEYMGKKKQGNDVQIEYGLRVGGGCWIEKTWGGRCSIKAGVMFRAPDTFAGFREDMVLTVPIAFNCFI